MADIQIRRGLKANVQGLVLKQGEMAVALDTGDVYVGTPAGTHHVNPTGGTADVAVKLATARAFSITGDGVAAAKNFDGTANVELALTLATMPGVIAGVYTKLTVDGKGRVTAGAQVNISDVQGAGTAAGKDTGTAPGNVVIVQSDGKIDDSLIPSLALTDVFTAANQTEMLALTGAEPGDICIRTDENKTYILKQKPFSTLANWVWLKTPDSAVLSVNGKTGAVTLTKGDVGLGNVDNTSDATKTVAKAGELTTGRTASLTGDATGTSAAWTGAGDLSIPVTLANTGVSAGTYTKVTTDAKGRVTAGATASPSDIGAATSAQGAKADSALQPSGAGTNLTVAFSQAATRANIATNATLATIMGLLAKWYADFKAIVFTGKWADIEDKPASFAPSAHTDATGAAVGQASASVFGHAKASSANPVAPGTAAAGTDNGMYAREGHVHPSQASVATLTTQRAFSITGGATAAAVNFNGGGNVVLNVTELDASKLVGTIDGGTF